MSTFNEVYNNIISITGRHDLQSFIEGRINSAINLLSASGKFKDDLIEITQVVDGDKYVQSVSLPARFRSIAYIDYPEIDPCDEPIINLDLSSLGHRSSRLKSNVYYVSGNLLHIKHDKLTPNFLIGYYEYPAPLSGNDTNWILTRFPALVEEIVIGQIRIITGAVEGAAYINQLTMMQRSIWLNDAMETGQHNVDSGRS